ARQPRRPNTTRREHTIPQQDKATHVSNHREHSRRISAPAGHRSPATAVETRTPVVRVRPRRLVAPINRTDQRTALTSGSTLVTGRLNRQRALSRKRLALSTPEHQTPGRPGNPWCPPRVAERRISIRSAVRKAGPV